MVRKIGIRAALSQFDETGSPGAHKAKEISGCGHDVNRRVRRITNTDLRTPSLL